MRRLKKIFVMFFSLYLLAILSSCSVATETLLYTLYIPCKIGASAYAIRPDGSKTDLGTISSIPETSRWPSYTASGWGKPGTVCASAVNAIHLLCSIEKEKGRTISILPQTTVAPAAGKKTFFTVRSDAGTGIFGGWAPPVGTKVYVRRPDDRQALLSCENMPAEGDILVIPVEETTSLPYIVDIENRPGGRIVAWYSQGPQIVARVIRPIYGTGRFEGTLFQRGSRIRANHTGVIDISTSPRGEIGGFQIMPLLHGASSEMASAWQLTQWMIIASTSHNTLVGTTPLFSDGLVPGTQLQDKLWDIWSTYERRPLILCRLDGGPWQFFPSVSGRQDKALYNMTHIRIYYPATKEPLQE